MSNVLELKEEDLKLMLAAGCHVGSKNCDANMKRYVWRRRNDGHRIIHLRKTWEKLVLAARIIVAIENPEDVVVISARTIGQRAVFKFAQHTGCSYVGGRYTPGTFTNQIQRRYMEPRLLIVTDPLMDNQPILESSYVNIPVIAFANCDSPLAHVDVAIPCDNKNKESIALMYWLLAREVLRMRFALSRNEPWNIMVDLFLYREPDEVNKDVETIPDTDVVLTENPMDVMENFANLSGGPPSKLEWGAEEGGFDTAAAPQVSAVGDVSDNWNQQNWNQPAATGGWEQGNY